ncbi:MAG: Ig-like domain-containing protein [bacterium]
MSFIQKGKNNIKYLAVIAFFAVISATGLLWFASSQKFEFPPFTFKIEFNSRLLVFNLYPIEPEMIKVSFNQKVDVSTLSSLTIKLFAVSVSAGSAGQKEELPGENLTYDYDEEEKTLTITPKKGMIGGCAACYYELELTNQIKDLRGNSLKPATYSQMTVNG